MTETQLVIEINQNDDLYPARLKKSAGRAKFKRIDVLGDPGILKQDLLGVFCSVRCPGTEILKLYDVARGLRERGVPVVSGFHTPMEKECLVTLLRGTQPIVICPARSLYRMRIPSDWRDGIAAGRIVIVSAFPASVRRASKATAAERNEIVAALAKEVLIAYAEPKGQTAALVDRLKSAGRTPLTLNSPSIRKLSPRS